MMMIIQTIGQNVISLWRWFSVTSASDLIQQSHNLRQNHCIDQTESIPQAEESESLLLIKAHTNQTGFISALDDVSNILHILASSRMGFLVKGIHCARRKLLDGGL